MAGGLEVRLKSTSYRDLEVWKKAIQLAKRIYELSSGFPTKKTYEMCQQMQRCAVSIAANIAEGQARHSHKEFRYFLGISLGSLAELETILNIAHEINYITDATLNEFNAITDEIARMIKGIIKHLTSLK
jgi:four helix bundle protein